MLDINVVINWQPSKEGIRWPVSLDRIAGSGVEPSRSSIFWSYPLIRYWFSNDRRLKFDFFKIRMKYVVFMCYKIIILIANWPRTRNSASCRHRQGRQLLLTFVTMFKLGHAWRPIFMLWLVKIWQVSSCGKFMQHLESCLLWQLKLTEFCVNLWCF